MNVEPNYNEKSKYYGYLAEMVKRLETELETKRAELTKAYVKHFDILDEVEDTQNSFEYQYSKGKVEELEAECLALSKIIDKVHETF